ncbi:MAG: zinc-ribbon domain-containing protein [Deltaproteobacteria bacterium]
MRFACQSCGKAYNLPEERIAEKSNVKLKCRVCGAIVEVKRQGELVAHVLDETEARQMARVSEAPAPLTSITPDDDDDPDGATVSISEASINDRGPLELEMPGASPTGFSSAAAAALSASALSSAALSASGFSPSAGLSSAVSSAAMSSAEMSSSAMSSSAMSSSAMSSGEMSSGGFSPPPLGRGEAGVERMDTGNVAPPLPPPPLSPSSLPPPPALHALDVSPMEAIQNGSATNGAALSNHSGAFFSDSASAEVDESLTPELRAPVAAAVLGSGVMAGALGSNVLAARAISPDLADFPAPEGEVGGKDPLFKIKMLAAFATGVLIDRIVAGLFQ